MNNFLWKSELGQIYHSSRLHQTLKKAGEEIKLQVTEKKEVGPQHPPHCVALGRVRLFLSATSASPSTTTSAANPHVHRPKHQQQQHIHVSITQHNNSSTSTCPSSKTSTAAAHPHVHRPAHLPAPGTAPATEPLHYSRHPYPTGNNTGRLQEDHSHCSMTLCCSSG